jgi:hypothetical protein
VNKHDLKAKANNEILVLKTCTYISGTGFWPGKLGEHFRIFINITGEQGVEVHKRFAKISNDSSTQQSSLALYLHFLQHCQVFALLSHLDGNIILLCYITKTGIILNFAF